MARPNKRDKTAYHARLQVVLHGDTLKMFNHDVSRFDDNDSELLRHIVREHYKRTPPIGYFKEKRH